MIMVPSTMIEPPQKLSYEVESAYGYVSEQGTLFGNQNIFLGSSR